MATSAMTLISERWLDEVVLRGSIDNTMGADIDEKFSAPAGLGDLAIMELVAIAQTLATPVTLNASQGARFDILSSDAATAVDILGNYPWRTERSDTMSVYCSPDPLVQWKEGELLRVLSGETDSNASPTGDLRIYVKAVRVRPAVSQEAPRSIIRLVR